MADADTCVVTDAASHSHTPVEGLEPNTPSPLAEPSSADMSEEGPFEPRITIPATSYPHIIDAIFASAPYASLLRLRTVDKAWKERADALLGRHLVFSTGGGRSAADPMRVEVSSLSTKNGKRVRRLRFRIERSTSLSVRAEAQRWLEREAFPLVLDLDNWGRHSGNSRWWLPAPIREAMEALRPPTVRIYGSSQAGMGLWGARTERSVVSTAIPPWNTHTAVKIVPAPVLPDTRTLVVNLTIHERGRHVPMGELATWDALPDDLEEIVLIVKDAETAKTFVPRTNTGFVPRPTAASLARQKAQQIRRTNEGRGGEGDRATRQEWGVLRPLHSWLVSAWRCGGVKALMRENHCIRITIVGMTEIKANHAGFTNAMSAEEKSKKLLESRDAIAEIWKGIPKNFEPTPVPAGPGSRSVSRGTPGRSSVRQQTLSASTASLTPSAASTGGSSLSTAVSELSLAPSAASTATAPSPSPAPAEEEFWSSAEVDKIISGIRFLTREEYKAECPDWAVEWEV